MNERRVFVKGIDLDTVLEYVENGKYRYAKNVHLGITDTGNAGTIENCKGNTQITNSNIQIVEQALQLPAGTLTTSIKCIGGKEDVLGQRDILFISSLLGYDHILEYNYSTGLISVIYVSTFLNFDRDFLITGINIVNGNLLYWTDDKTSPKKINIDKAKLAMESGFTDPDGYSYIFPETIEAIKYPPLFPPVIQIETDLVVNKNNIRNKNFQFKYRYIKDDGEKTAFSPISEVSVPQSSEFVDPSVSVIPALSFINNRIRVYLSTGINISEKIELAVRQGNEGDFYLFDTYDKSQQGWADSATVSVLFYNDKILEPIEIKDSIQLFDNVPRLAKAQEFIDGNKLVYGNIFEGYNNPKSLDVGLTPVYTNISGGATFTWAHTFPINGGFFSLGASSQTNADMDVAGGIFDVTVTYFGSVFGSLPAGIYNINTGSYTPTANPTPISFYSGTISFFIDGNGNTVITIHALTTNGNISDNTGSDALIIDIPNEATMVLPNASNISDYGTSQYYPQVGDTILITGTGTPTPTTVSYVLTQADVSDYYSNGAFTLMVNLISVSNGALYNYTVNGFTLNSTTLNTISIFRPVLKFGSFKSGAVHPFGLVYYDFANRSGTTVRDNTFDVYAKLLPESRAINTASYIQRIGIDWSINHLPPDWATHYQWVYTGNTTVSSFLQFIAGDTPVSSGTYSEISMQPLVNFNAANSTNSILSYSWTQGDRVRFLTDSGHGGYGIVLDVEVFGYGDSTATPPIQVLKTQLISNSGITITAGTLMEIYSPKSQIENTIYFEFSEAYEIGSAGTQNAFHKGENSDQVVVNGVSTSPATGHFERGDVWIRPRHMDATPIPFIAADDYVEDFNISDFYASKFWDKGRPNRVSETEQPLNGGDEFREIRRSTTIDFSDVFVPETNINGLSRFYDFNFESYDPNYGSIQKLHSYEKRLEVYQERKVGAIPINQKVALDDSNNIVTYQTDQVLNQIVYFQGNYGIGKNPESFAAFENRRYFADINNGFIVRLSTDGMTPISQVYKIHSYITNLFRDIMGFKLKVPIYGVYNKAFGQYEVAIERKSYQSVFNPNGLIHSIGGDTFAFCEPINAWTSWYDYEPECMVSSNQDIITLKDGGVWAHNTNSLYNNFYGTQYSSDLSVVGNTPPNEVKVYNNLSLESSGVWEAYEIVNNQGQLSNLITSDFELYEGKWYSSFLMDINTPNNTDPLNNGDNLRDSIILLKLRNSSTGYVKILAVNIDQTQSFKTL